MEQKKIIAVIPARYGSSRFPGKVLAEIWGKPLIYYTYRQATKATLVDEVLVATDNERVFCAVEEFGGKVVMTSPYHNTGTDRVAEVASRIEAHIIVNVQGDEPGIHPESIDAAISPLLEDKDIDVTNLMAPIRNPEDLVDAMVVKVAKDVNDFFLFLTRSPIPYPKSSHGYHAFRQLGVYAFRRKFLLKYAQMPQTPLEMVEGIEFMRILENGYRVKGVLTELESFDVDTPEDLEEARRRLAPEEGRMDLHYEEGVS